MEHAISVGFEEAIIFNSKPKSTIRNIIIIPAKNEQDDILCALEALRTQKHLDGQQMDYGMYEVLVLANNCNDATYEHVFAYAKEYPNFNLSVESIFLEAGKAHVGTARRMLMDEAYHRLMIINQTDGIIISTDADTVVDKFWLYYILEAFKSGCDAVGGRILSKNDYSKVSKHHLLDVTYRYLSSKLEAMLDPCAYDPWPRHFQCFGPSIAVRCSSYHKAGRLPSLPFLEDEAFRKAMLRADIRIRRCPKAMVYTSSRLIGKVDFGYSVQLQRWKTMEDEGLEQTVEPLSALCTRFRNKSRLRHVYAAYQNRVVLFKEIKQLNNELLINQQFIVQLFKQKRSFGYIWEKIEEQIPKEKWNKRFPPAPIRSAINELRMYCWK